MALVDRSRVQMPSASVGQLARASGGRSVSDPHDRVGGVVEREDRGARHQVHERLPGRFEAMMFSRAEADHCAHLRMTTSACRRGTVTSRCARARIGSRCARLACSSATTHTSPMLLRLPLRFGFGPSTFGREQALLRRSPRRTCRSSSSNVAVYSSSAHFTSTRPSVQIVVGVGLAVGAVGERHRLELLELLREDVAADARHAGLRQHLDAVDPVVDRRTPPAARRRQPRRRADRASRRRRPSTSQRDRRRASR